MLGRRLWLLLVSWLELSAAQERLEHTVVRKKKMMLRKSDKAAEGGAGLGAAELARQYNQYSDQFPGSEEDAAFRSSGCRWSSISDPHTRSFYEATSKCFHKMRWKEPEYLEVTCDGAEKGNQTLIDIVEYIRAFTMKYGKIYFFGDSTMQQQTLVMDCMLQVALGSAVDPPQWISARGHDRFEKSLELLLETDFSPDDVIIGNLGLHYQRNFSTIGKKHLIEDVTLLSQSLVNLTISSREAKNGTNYKQSPPQFVWREGTPQNYPTRNGWWPYFFNTCVRKCHCTKLTYQMRRGNGSMIAFSPQLPENTIECSYPSQDVNSVACDIISSFDLNFTSVYDALAAAPVNLHGGRGTPFDCTHFGIDGLIFMNMALIRDIFPLNAVHAASTTKGAHFY